MQTPAPPRVTLNIYIFTILVSFIACTYAFLKPGITPPIFPESRMRKALSNTEIGSMASSSKTKLNKDTSDRTTSPLHTYQYRDGSKIMAVMVRVKKRDDFKIETYGLLTKNIDPIYIKSSTIVPSGPPSLYGVIGKDKFFQTCIVPKTSDINESDFRLDNLIGIVERLNPRSNSILDKITGLKKHVDYSCLVLTYKPANISDHKPPENWQKVIRKTQEALSF